MRLPKLSKVMVLAIVGMSSSVQADSGDLETAFKREFAFLEAEKQTLQKRLTDVEQEHARKVAAARREIEQLQGQATKLALDAERMQEQLLEADETSAEEVESADVLSHTLQQAEVALRQGGVTLPSAGEEGEISPSQRLSQLEFAFDKGVSLLGRYGEVRREPGHFFALDGKKLSGEVIHVGRIGAYGVADNAAGALAPAGEDRLKLWPQGDTASAARALASGSRPDTLQLFLFESLEKEIPKPHEKTVEDLLKAGGPIGYVIVVLGFAALLMIVARGILLARAAVNTGHLVDAIAPLVKQRKLDEALKRARAEKSAAGRVLEATLQHLGRPRDHLEDVISEAVLREQPTLDRFGSSIMVAAAVAPLLGLLGTVTGMIATFDVITEYGNANPKLLAGGISEALVTTELGLIVAIPALLIGNLLSGWSQRIKDDMDSAALRVTNIANGEDVSELMREDRASPPAPAAFAPAE